MLRSELGRFAAGCWLLRRAAWTCAMGAAMLALAGCSATKHVPPGRLLLDKADIEVEGDGKVKSADLVNYLRQMPNHKVLLGWRLQLATYNLSGRDSTKKLNQWLRKLGQAPVVYDTTMTRQSARQLGQAMVNRGYMDAKVEVDTASHGRKMDVTYRVTTGAPHRVASVAYEIPDSAIAEIVLRDTMRLALKPGMPLDRDALEGVRASITERMRNRGYYSFRRDFVTFVADTAENSKDVQLTMRVTPGHKKAYINRVCLVTNYRGSDNPLADVVDSAMVDGITVLYGPDRYIKPGTLAEKCYLLPGTRYSARNVSRTYEGLSQLGILKSISIDFVPQGVEVRDGQEVEVLNAYVLMSRQKKQSVTIEAEGTNSEGDLGFGVGLTYQHRNLAHGSQLLTTRFRMNYESLSGNLNGLINDHYTEYIGEVGLTFPRLEVPFVGTRRRRLNVTTEAAAQFNLQERPEYTRIIAGAAWRYKWLNPQGTRRHIFDVIDVNYVYLPHRTIDFLNEIAPDNPLLRYSYEDHFIVRIGYSYYFTNRRMPQTALPGTRAYNVQPIVYTLRVSAETAGNLLYALSWAAGAKKHQGAYFIFGTQFAQYAKAEADYGISRSSLDGRQSVAFHAGLGVGVPYGNSSAIPFEKRFYGGGANGVRGWSVRTLGPGSYDGKNSVTDFINQCGDIRLDLSLEYRLKLFWVLAAAAFVDAGNIWTIRDYPNQPGGVFRFGKFYKQIAAAYGLGLRLDFEYFLLRFDLGIKAHNPAKGQEPWPIVHPNWHRDATLHFAVGYPF